MKQPPRIAIVSASRSVQRHATRALVSAGYAVERYLTQRDEMEAALAVQHDMYLIDTAGDEEQVGWLIEALRTHHRDAIPLLLSNDLRNPFLFDLLTRKGLNNLVARHGGVSAAHEFIDEHELIITCYKLFERDIFGIEKHLPAFGITPRSHIVKRSREKETVLQELDQYLEAIDCYGVIAPAISLVADELLTNAIYNAPRDGAGRPTYAHLDRREPVELAPHEHVTFRYACDGRYVLLSVSDQFGSLDRDVIVRYIEHAFAGERASTEFKKGGAGLGLYMVLNSITQLTFNILSGQRTEVIALFYIRGGGRVFKSSGRSLNIFMIGD